MVCLVMESNVSITLKFTKISKVRNCKLLTSGGEQAGGTSIRHKYRIVMAGQH